MTPTPDEFATRLQADKLHWSNHSRFALWIKGIACGLFKNTDDPNYNIKQADVERQQRQRTLAERMNQDEN
jgi:hypothetical protein